MTKRLIAKDVTLFQDITQYFDGFAFDLHNDFLLDQLRTNDGNVVLVFRKPSNECVTITFYKAEITSKENVFYGQNKGLIIDTIYRGRYESSGSLLEFDEFGRGYFYIDFVQDLSFELFCAGLEIEV